LEPETIVTRCIGTRDSRGKGIVMITDGFGPRMAANMEVALERACEFLPVGNEKHEARRYVASKILECAERGNGTVLALTAAGRAAAIELHSPSAGDSGGPKKPLPGAGGHRTIP
jgi:hypothetical protein